MECLKCNGLNSKDAKFCTSCGASIKESPEEELPEPNIFSQNDFIKNAVVIVLLAAFVIIGFGVFWYAISSWGWIWGIVGGIIIILLCILFRTVP
jgi:fatty acid desaturase